MSSKIYFLDRLVYFFPEYLGVVRDESGERFHQQTSANVKEVRTLTVRWLTIAVPRREISQLQKLPENQQPLLSR